MTLHDDLVAAKALIDTPEKWGKGEHAYYTAPFCVLGACRAVASKAPEDDRLTPMRKALRHALPPDFRDDSEIFDYATTRFNDAQVTTHTDAMSLFDRAIAAASPNRIVTGSEGGMA